jgi:lysophospholipase
MNLDAAPILNNLKDTLLPGTAYWVRASDNTRLRIAIFNQNSTMGTILFFPGRTDYIEKYQHTATDLAQRGYTTIIIDWRGQGLADRMLDNTRIGHVNSFIDYQKDVDVMTEAVNELQLPKPYYLIAHSMGGCIGLRSIYRGLDVKASAFTGPMWGIQIKPYLRLAAWTTGQIMPALGQGHRLPPGKSIEPYVLNARFEDNQLTSDFIMYEMMRKQLQMHPELSLGSPSFQWIGEALWEMLSLSKMPAPSTPSKVFLGTDERIIDPTRIKARMKNWANGTLHIIQKGRHELLMEDNKTRSKILNLITNEFAKAI